jgi:hypothetical protein
MATRFPGDEWSRLLKKESYKRVAWMELDRGDDVIIVSTVCSRKNYARFEKERREERRVTGVRLLAELAVSLVSDDGESWRLPVNEMGEPCPWPFDPLRLKGQPIGMYHCPYCGGMQLAGVPHTDYSGDEEAT